MGQDILYVSVYDQIGQERISYLGSMEMEQLDLRKLEKGMYYLDIRRKNGLIYHSRIIKN